MFRNMIRFAFVLALLSPAPALAGGDWNDDGIAWKAYAEGLEQAKAEEKPVCLIFYTDWCPHCTKYSKMFHDEKVVEKSKSFVMIRLNKDEHAEVSKKYKPDGEYIPRTFFLASDGTLDPSLSEQRDRYKYFYGYADPGSILAGMDRALVKFK